MFGPTHLSSTTSSSLLITAIRDQIESTPPHLVFVIDIVSVRFGGYFTHDIKSQLEKYTNLQMLTLNDCGIVSLQNFPYLPALIRLDLVFNSIPSGHHLIYLQRSTHIQTLMMGANKLEKLQDLRPLLKMRQLLQLDLINNPVTFIPGYRNQVFLMFPTLSILDTLDKGGKDAYANTTMVEAVSRIPDSLFDKSKPIVVAPNHAPIHRKETSKLKKALVRTGSLDSMTGKVKKLIPKAPSHDSPKIPHSRGKYGKSKKLVAAGRSKAAKAGLVFPVGRLKRKMKQVLVGYRVSVGSSIFMAAILQYLSAELLQISGNVAKGMKKTRITPSMIKDSLKHDEQMKQLLSNVTISTMNE